MVSPQLFAPTPGPSRFSRLHNAEAIMTRNADAARPRRSELANLFLYYRLAQSMAQEGGGDGQLECTHQ